MVINVIAKTVMKKLAVMEKRITMGGLKTATAKNMAGLTIINTGLVILMVNWEMSFGGKDGFNVDWYEIVGAKVMETMFITIIVTVLSNSFAVLLTGLKRCCDRGCTTNSRKTKKFTQPDYEDINTGPEFPIDLRYSSIVTYVFIVMMYSGGMPALYPLASIFFFALYWADKTLMISHFRKPPQYDNYIALHMLSWFKVAFLFHISISFWMFSSKEIFDSHCTEEDVLECAHVKHYLFVVFCLLGLWLIYKCLAQCTSCGKFLEDEQHPSDNFFSNCSYATLRD